MPETLPLKITPEIAADIDQIIGDPHNYAAYVKHIGGCFGCIDFDAVECAGDACIAQRACAIHTGQRYGIDVRPFVMPGLRFLPDKKPDGTPTERPNPTGVPNSVSDHVRGLIIAAVNRPQPPLPVAAAPAPPPPVPPAPQITVTSVAPAPPPPPPLPATSPPPPTVAEAVPVMTGAIPQAPAPAHVAHVPADGSPPPGFPGLERDALVALCHELGCTDQEMTKRRAVGLVKLILSKRPQWAPAPVGRGRSTKGHAGSGDALVLPPPVVNEEDEEGGGSLTGTEPSVPVGSLAAPGIRGITMQGSAGDLAAWAAVAATLFAGRRVTMAVQVDD